MHVVAENYEQTHTHAHAHTRGTTKVTIIFEALIYTYNNNTYEKPLIIKHIR